MIAGRLHFDVWEGPSNDPARSMPPEQEEVRAMLATTFSICCGALRVRLPLVDEAPVLRSWHGAGSLRGHGD